MFARNCTESPFPEIFQNYFEEGEVSIGILPKTFQLEKLLSLENKFEVTMDLRSNNKAIRKKMS